MTATCWPDGQFDRRVLGSASSETTNLSLRALASEAVLGRAPARERRALCCSDAALGGARRSGLGFDAPFFGDSTMANANQNQSPTRNSLIKLNKQEPVGRQNGWYHVNVKQNRHLKLRHIPELQLQEYDDIAWEDIRDQVVADCHLTPDDMVTRLGIDRSDIAAKYPEALCSIVRRLEVEDHVKRIPVTNMRLFYEWMRSKPNGISPSDLHGGLARQFEAQPAKLAGLFVESQGEFSRYNNEGEAFIDGREPLAVSPTATAGTNAYVNAVLRHSERAIELENDLGFVAVARELPPMRSTRLSGPWVFADGRPASSSGDGGVDLLMRSRDNDVPIVGEIKVEDDTTPFLALIQVLTYAAELNTARQRSRLQNHFVDDFANLEQDGPIDLYLLFHDLPSHCDEIFASTAIIAQGMFQHGAFGEAVRRIVFVKSNGDLAQDWQPRIAEVCEPQRLPPT